ncbi:hypothetical protein M5689_006537 [Euphorbia peplus]|nr:hypothetical protein M5689_006537 [Euphorbia peplus]
MNDWKYLVNLWSEATFQEKKNGKKPSRVDVYIESRKRKTGKGVDPLAQDVIAQFKQLKKQLEEGNNSLNVDDIFSKVIGPEKNGYVHSYGPGKSVTGYFGGRPTQLDLLKQVEVTRIEANERVREALYLFNLICQI